MFLACEKQLLHATSCWRKAGDSCPTWRTAYDGARPPHPTNAGRTGCTAGSIMRRGRAIFATAIACCCRPTGKLFPNSGWHTPRRRECRLTTAGGSTPSCTERRQGGGAMCCDATLVTRLSPHPGRATTDSLHDLLRVRAQRSPPALRPAACAGWTRRWWGMLSVAVQQAAASTALGRGLARPAASAPTRRSSTRACAGARTPRQAPAACRCAREPSRSARARAVAAQ